MIKHFKIHGRVHGVGFRYYCERQATRLGLKGWAKNVEKDKTVEVCLQGPQKDIKEMQRFLNIGPPLSEVTMIEEVDHDQEDNYNTFNIVYEGWN